VNERKIKEGKKSTLSDYIAALSYSGLSLMCLRHLFAVFYLNQIVAMYINEFKVIKTPESQHSRNSKKDKES
jgi:hypothetical protein